MNYSTGIMGVGAIHAWGNFDHEYGFYHIHEDAYKLIIGDYELDMA